MTIWKDVKGYEGLYQVSDSGIVQVLARSRKNRHGEVIYPGRMLKPATSKKGYLKVGLTLNGCQTVVYIHNLVATHFVDGQKPGLEINHKDGNKLNNNDWNLEWVTHQQNLKHAGKMKLMCHGKKHRRYNPALHPEDNI